MFSPWFTSDPTVYLLELVDFCWVYSTMSLLPGQASSCLPGAVSEGQAGNGTSTIYRWYSQLSISMFFLFPQLAMSFFTMFTGWWFGTWILFSIFFHNIWDVILPIDELHHFSRWLLHHQAVHLCSLACSLSPTTWTLVPGDGSDAAEQKASAWDWGCWGIVLQHAPNCVYVLTFYYIL